MRKREDHNKAKTQKITIPNKQNSTATQIKYHTVQVVCACGNRFTTKAVYKENIIKIEICSNCHPFYTKSTSLLDTAGTIDVFKRKFGNLEDFKL